MSLITMEPGPRMMRETGLMSDIARQVLESWQQRRKSVRIPH